MAHDGIQSVWQLKQFGEFGDVNPSITDSATFTFLEARSMVDTFEGRAEGCYLYSRHWNPMNKYLADALAALEGTEMGWITSSGMGAISTTLLQICSAGDHIVAARTIYGGTYALLLNYLPKFNITTTFVDITNIDAVKNAIKPNTKVIYTETITNPLLQVSDIPALAAIANENKLKLVVDNTFAPLIVAPSPLGAHVVVHSLTKFINGKNDCVAGAICSSKEFINELIDVNSGTAMLLGPVLDTVRSASILKNLHTLHLRIKHHSHNASYLADRFNEVGIHTIYPGRAEHKGNQVLARFMNPKYGFGGLLAIDMLTPERANLFMETMQERGVGYLAVSLGYFRTLFSNSGSSTSSEIPACDQKEMGLSPGLVRFSVGLDEDISLTWNTINSCLQDLKMI